VAPAVALTKPAPSASRLDFPLARPTSNTSVIAVGCVMLLLEFVPKKPSTTSPGAVVVIEGAVIDPVRRL
jgi:hypothetical protein